MDLSFITGNNQSLVDSLEEYGCDLESLLYVAKDFFGLCDELQLTPRQTSEIFIKLKNTNDIANGKPLSPDILVYENSRSNPTRLCVENRNTNKNVFFKICPGQGKIDKNVAVYRCESCADEASIKRTDIREHFLDKHFN